jgi:hypothetical protein
VSDDEDRFSLVAQTSQQVHHIGGGVNIYVGKRLVEQQNPGIVEQRSRQRHALPHALRVLANGALQRGIEADGTDHSGTTCSIGEPIKLREIGQIFHSAHFVVKQRGVRHVADLIANVVKFARPEDGDLATAKRPNCLTRLWTVITGALSVNRFDSKWQRR